MDPHELLSTCEPFFQELLKKFGNGTATSIGILHGGRTYFHGLSTKADATPDEDTVYLISSMTKPVVGLAIGILVSMGKFQLDTPVGDIIDLHLTCEHRNGEPVLIKDLLDHTTELWRSDRLWEMPDGDIGIKDKAVLVGLCEHIPRNHQYTKPSAFHNTRNYNNLAFAVLAMIIEQVTGMCWTEFIHVKIFDALGMTRSTMDLSTRRPEGNIAGSYCSRITLDTAALATDDQTRADFHQRLLERVRDSDQVAVPRPVPSSKCSDTTTYLGAACAVRSTVSDKLKFYGAYSSLFNKVPDRQLTEFEAGALVILDHIKSRAQHLTCAYAGGWNIVNLPWDHVQRAPCADGDIYERMQAVAKLGIAGFQEKQEIWPFFHGDTNKSREAAWFHGGNMMGATSYAFVLPVRESAVVVLSDARSFVVDPAHLIATVLADCLYSGLGQDSVRKTLDSGRLVSTHCAAYYLAEVANFEKEIPTGEDELASAHTYRDFVGKYTYPEIGLSLEVLAKGDHLELRYATFQYPLRVVRQGDPDKVTMSFARPVDDLHVVGLGGKHSVRSRVYEITFLGDNRLMWTFEEVINEETVFVKEVVA